MSYFMKQQVYSALWKPLDSISCLTRRYFATMNGNTTTTNGARHCTEPVKKSMKMSNDNVCDDEMRTQEDDFGSHENPMRLEVLRLSDKATLPKRGSPLAAGVDLYSAKDITIPAAGKALVPTDISIALPSNTYGRIAPRSSLAAKHHLDVGAGVVDEDYRGPVGVVMFNFGKDDYHVKAGERIAQLIVERIWRPDVVEVSKLSETVRGEGGFGSTGKH